MKSRTKEDYLVEETHNAVSEKADRILERLEGQNRNLKRLLRKHQWILNPSTGFRFCPNCGHLEKHGHGFGCEIDNTLRGE